MLKIVTRLETDTDSLFEFLNNRIFCDKTGDGQAFSAQILNIDFGLRSVLPVYKQLCKPRNSMSPHNWKKMFWLNRVNVFRMELLDEKEHRQMILSSVQHSSDP
jgi:hypothetical protein